MANLWVFFVFFNKLHYPRNNKYDGVRDGGPDITTLHLYNVQSYHALLTIQGFKNAYQQIKSKDDHSSIGRFSIITDAHLLYVCTY